MLKVLILISVCHHYRVRVQEMLYHPLLSFIYDIAYHYYLAILLKQNACCHYNTVLLMQFITVPHLHCFYC